MRCDFCHNTTVIMLEIHANSVVGNIYFCWFITFCGRSLNNRKHFNTLMIEWAMLSSKPFVLHKRALPQILFPKKSKLIMWISCLTMNYKTFSWSLNKLQLWKWNSGAVYFCLQLLDFLFLCQFWSSKISREKFARLYNWD